MAFVLSILVQFAAFMMPESPKWQMSVGLEAGAIQSLQTIGSYNGQDDAKLNNLKSLSDDHNQD